MLFKETKKIKIKRKKINQDKMSEGTVNSFSAMEPIDPIPKWYVQLFITPAKNAWH